MAQQPGAHLLSCPESTMGANTDAPWWRRWTIWVALALATVALFLPVLR